MKKPFANLDKILNPGASFEFKGETYDISPINIGEYMKFNNAWVEIEAGFKGKKLSEDEFRSAFFNLISSCCPKFTMETLNQMSLVQVGAVVQLIIEIRNGHELDEDDIKKKVFSMVP